MVNWWLGARCFGFCPDPFKMKPPMNHELMEEIYKKNSSNAASSRHQKRGAILKMVVPNNWLVVLTHLKNISQVGNLPILSRNTHMAPTGSWMILLGKNQCWLVCLVCRFVSFGNILCFLVETTDIPQVGLFLVEPGAYIHLPSLKLTVRTWKWLEYSFFLGWPIFRGYVSFRECK